jgi:hypothetical protein
MEDHRVLTIALHRGLYLAIIMDRYDGPKIALTIALYRGLYIANTMVRFEGPHSALSIALHRRLLSHCNGSLWRTPECR